MVLPASLPQVLVLLFFDNNSQSKSNNNNSNNQAFTWFISADEHIFSSKTCWIIRACSLCPSVKPTYLGRLHYLHIWAAITGLSGPVLASNEIITLYAVEVEPALPQNRRSRNDQGTITLSHRWMISNKILRKWTLLMICFAFIQTDASEISDEFQIIS